MSEWIEWAGGERPVPGKIVEVKDKAGFHYDTPSDWLDWEHINCTTDIIAYRIIKDTQ